MTNLDITVNGDKGLIGGPQVRAEDDRLVRGIGCYVDDVEIADCLHVAFVRSPHADARFIAPDIAAAAAAPGVVAVFAGADVADLGDLPVNALEAEVAAPPFPILARDRVMAVGAPVAAVVAETRAGAVDAADLIEIDFRPEDPVTATGDSAWHKSWRAGDIDHAFADADAVVRTAVQHPRLAPSPMEPRAVLAAWDGADERLTIWVSSQTPHRARTDMAHILGLDEDRVRAIAPDVGGAFGMKASLYPEDVLVAWAAMRIGRPVKWTATRGEDLLAATHGRGAATEGALAVAADGRFLGLRARIASPLGHWMPYSAAVPAWNAGRILPGPYAVPAIDIAARADLSNTAPVGIYRGAGRPEAAMLMERLVDAAARATGIDPATLRQRNLIPADAMPFRTPTGAVFDSGDYGAALARACEAVDYDRLRAEQATRRAAGDFFGIGLACYVEPCGQGWESAAIRLETDGSVTVASGGSDQGQGRSTAAAQIVATVLGRPYDRITVIHGDTETAPAGVGALASRSTAIGGSALLRAAEALRDRARDVAAGQLEVDADALCLDGDGFAVLGGPRLTWEEVAAAANVDSHVVHHVDGEAWGYGCYIATLSIDRETGAPRVERMTCVDDIGVVVNPRLVEGQVIGGIAQGLGEAMKERIVYDDDGQLLTGSLMDYALPRAADMPPIDLVTMTTPSPYNPLGAKGVGEAGCIGAPAAIMNAAIDALAPLGVDDLDMPLTSETIWRAMTSAGNGA